MKPAAFIVFLFIGAQALPLAPNAHTAALRRDEPNPGQNPSGLFPEAGRSPQRQGMPAKKTQSKARLPPRQVEEMEQDAKTGDDAPDRTTPAKKGDKLPKKGVRKGTKA